LLTRLFKEPLVQFLLLGAGLFLAYSLFAPQPEVPREQIVVDQPVVRSLEAAFEAVWKRPPSASERQGLINDHIAEEVLYREAQKLGLDQDDVVIRRRMRQKMQFLLQDSLALMPPDEAALRTFYEEEQERYREPDRHSFQQLFLGVRQGPEEAARWEALAVRLNGAGPSDLEQLAQPSLLPPRMVSARPAAIDRVFGAGFAKKIEGLESGRWSGPITSSYGWHLVRIDAVVPGGQPSFEMVRAQVERDFAYQRQQESEAALIERLKQQYEIVIEEAAR
jgi:hypothetical protein